MAWRSGSMSRTFLNAARSPTVSRSATNSSAFRRRPPPLLPNSATSTPRLSFTNPRALGVLACAQSLMPMHSVVADARLTSHVAVAVRACCELSQGT
ncbi:uncharacterized protein LOC141623147 [Silene latifolia]|uniref:uncharacterized protein LOC141623147 n=1 Tax=Silene latifolia TaxID=37657 RepID=UPI003D7893A6